MIKKFFSFIIIVYSFTEVLADEIRISGLAHDVGTGLKQRHEKGGDLQLEYIAGSDFVFLFARPHLGATLNTRGYSSNIYSGLSWKLDFSYGIFVEASFGGGAHNANLKKSGKKRTLGSRLLFRESLSVGAQFTDEQSLSLMVDHMSNAGLAQPNNGMTNFGLRYGYRF